MDCGEIMQKEINKKVLTVANVEFPKSDVITALNKWLEDCNESFKIPEHCEIDIDMHETLVIDWTTES